MTKTSIASVLFMLVACTPPELAPSSGDSSGEGSSSSGTPMEPSSSSGEEVPTETSESGSEESTTGYEDSSSGDGVTFTSTTSGGQDLPSSESEGSSSGSTTEAPVPEPVCGNLAVEDGEECDDGDQDDTDKCVSCKLATCGDGGIWKGHELCDDGNDSNEDACVEIDGKCKEATCGDGFVQAGVEDCDDQNLMDQDGCGNDCKVSKDPCGQPMYEMGATWLRFDWGVDGILNAKEPVIMVSSGNVFDWAIQNQQKPLVSMGGSAPVQQWPAGRAAPLGLSYQGNDGGMVLTFSTKSLTSYGSATICLEGWSVSDQHPSSVEINSNWNQFLGYYNLGFSPEMDTKFSALKDVGTAIPATTNVSLKLAADIPKEASAVRSIRLVFHNAVLK